MVGTFQDPDFFARLFFADLFFADLFFVFHQISLKKKKLTPLKDQGHKLNHTPSQKPQTPFKHSPLHPTPSY